MEPALAQISGLRSLAPAKINVNKRVPTLSDTPPSTKRYACSLCEKSYSKQSTLGQHKKYKHPPEDGTAARFWCEHCGATFQRPEGPRNHIVNHRCSVLRNRLPHRGPLPLSDSVDVEASSALDASYFGSSKASLATIACGPHAQIHIPQHYSKRLRRLANAQRQAQRLDRWVTSFDAGQGVRIYGLGGVGKSILHSRSRRCADKRHVLGSSLCHGEDLETPLRPVGEGRAGVLRAKRDVDARAPKERCREWRRHTPIPFPPAFTLPPPRDLETLVREQDREKRRLRMLESFKATHRKLVESNHVVERTGVAVPVAEDGAKFSQHRTGFKFAWRDGMNAAQQILHGILPRELHSVLGVAQLASAIRAATDDIELPAASESKFLSDLSRWRQLLPNDAHAAFDFYADTMWENRPPSGLAWKDPHDAGTLVYFQDLLVEMFALIEFSPPERTTPDQTPDFSDIPLLTPSSATDLSTLPSPVHDHAQSAARNPVEDVPSQDEHMPTTIGEVVLFTSGAIFALILTFFLRES
jgi:hypothetical protein